MALGLSVASENVDTDRHTRFMFYKYRSNNSDVVKNYISSVDNVRFVCGWRFPLQLDVVLVSRSWKHKGFKQIMLSWHFDTAMI